MRSGRTATSGRCGRREMLADYDVAWFEEPLQPDALEDYVRLREAAPRADRRRRGADPPAVVPAVAAGGRLRHRPARRHQGRRHQRGAPHRLDGRTTTASASSRTAGTPPSAWPPTSSSPPPCPAPTWSSTAPARPTSTSSPPAAGSSTATACWPSPTRPGSASSSTRRRSRATRAGRCRPGSPEAPPSDHGRRAHHRPGRAAHRQRRGHEQELPGLLLAERRR